MKVESNSVVAQKLKILQTKFHEQLPERIGELISHWQQFLSDDDLSFLKKCQHSAHSLAGSALTFDAVVVGNLAREFELSVKKFVESHSFPGESQSLLLQQQLDTLESECLSWNPDGFSIEDSFDVDADVVNESTVSDGAILQIYLLEDDELLAQKIKKEFSKARLNARVFKSVVELGDACRDSLPELIVMDVASSELEIDSIAVLEQLHEDCILLPSVIFLSPRSDTQSRLAAVRVGVVRNIAKPFEISALIDDINIVTGHGNDDPYRVMLVDDDETLAEHNSAVLQSAGMVTKSVSDPMQVLESLDSFKPDLILLDYHLPGCNGVEIAGVIRQDARWMKTEIVFLSSELDFGKQVSGLDFDDDFLIKPVSPNVLVDHLRVRLKRARRAATFNDSLAKSSGKHAVSDSAALKIELNDLQQELKNAKEEIVRANKSKSEFLSRMNHELRTPMNSIIGFGQLLEMEQDQALTPLQLDNIREITKAGRRLLELVNKVLDLANVESGGVDLSLEAICLSDVLSECRSLVLPMAKEKNINLYVSRDDVVVPMNDCDELDIVVTADRYRLKQVLWNLLSNAIKYNNDGGKVTVSYSTMKNDVRISVVDTGEGLDKGQQSLLFKPFVRMSRDEEDLDGVGIGLVFARKLVEQMDGRMGVKSEKGSGSEFWFELPMGVLPAFSHVDENTLTGNDDNIVLTKRKYNVLYIEDNMANVKLVSQILSRREDIKLWCAHEPYLGLSIVEENQLDLVLLDVNLPGMNGYEVLEKIKSSFSVPVFAISADALNSDIEKGYRAGFDMYLTKPINIDRLVSSVDEVLLRSKGCESVDAAS